MAMVISSILYFSMYWILIPLLILTLIAILLMLCYDEGVNSLKAFYFAFFQLKWWNKIAILIMFLFLIPATIPRSIKYHMGEIVLNHIIETKLNEFKVLELLHESFQIKLKLLNVGKGR